MVPHMRVLCCQRVRCWGRCLWLTGRKWGTLERGCRQSQWARACSLERLHDHTQIHHGRWDSSGRVISPSHRPLPNNTQHPQQTPTHATDGIQTHNPSKRAAAGPRVRPRGHWDRLWLVQLGKCCWGDEINENAWRGRAWGQSGCFRLVNGCV
jgi:hypothetical protein